MGATDVFHLIPEKTSYVILCFIVEKLKTLLPHNEIDIHFLSYPEKETNYDFILAIVAMEKNGLAILMTLKYGINENFINRCEELTIKSHQIYHPKIMDIKPVKTKNTHTTYNWQNLTDLLNNLPISIHTHDIYAFFYSKTPIYLDNPHYQHCTEFDQANYSSSEMPFERSNYFPAYSDNPASFSPKENFSNNWQYSYYLSLFDKSIAERLREFEQANLIVQCRKSAVNTSYLRMWYHENIVNPYPTKEEKIRLGLLSNMSILQVNNWFANYRRKIKKINVKKSDSIETLDGISSTSSLINSTECSDNSQSHQPEIRSQLMNPSFNSLNLNVLANVALNIMNNQAD
ncbi:hypothetical protein HZS_6562 [Henneguya salminicola]|nr:hypothetical protein HZS_6562 [Henneguya salminicola]